MGAASAENKYSGAVEAGLARSRRVAAFVGIAACATLALVIATPMRLDAAIGLATAVACLALDALRRARHTHRLVIDRDGAICVDGRAGRVAGGSFVAPWLAIIRWRPAGARLSRTLLVATDMLPEDAFRELRVIVRFIVDAP